MATPAGIEPATFSLEVYGPPVSHPFFPQLLNQAIAMASEFMHDGEMA
jgi:hypothetical protein